MSYPEHRYTGEGGESTTWHRPSTQHLTSSTRMATQPTTSSPGIGATGCWVCINGTWVRSQAVPALIFTDRSPSRSTCLRDQSGSWMATTGSTASPVTTCMRHQGGLHGFRNESGEPASILILFAPGAPREAYFRRPADLERAHGRRTGRLHGLPRQPLGRSRITAPEHATQREPRSN